MMFRLGVLLVLTAVFFACFAHGPEPRVAGARCVTRTGAMVPATECHARRAQVVYGGTLTVTGRDTIVFGGAAVPHLYTPGMAGSYVQPPVLTLNATHYKQIMKNPAATSLRAVVIEGTR